jgi:hypothetical protein
LGGDFIVTSTLGGKTVPPERIRWLAHPSLPPSEAKEVDFVIDGKLRWIEQRAPYSYEDDGESLVTSWLAHNRHRAHELAAPLFRHARSDRTRSVFFRCPVNILFPASRTSGRKM